jgi:hypothetical protein
MPADVRGNPPLAFPFAPVAQVAADKRAQRQEEVIGVHDCSSAAVLPGGYVRAIQLMHCLSYTVLLSYDVRP